MNGNPPVKVGDRIVALEFHPAYTSVGKSHALHEAEVRDNDCRDLGRSHLDVRFGDGRRACVTRWRLADDPYRPAKGDRVRLKGTELEGVVKVDPTDGTFGVWFEPFNEDETAHEFAYVKPERLERLPEPDPEMPERWPPRQGDVIQVSLTTYIVTSRDGKDAVDRSGDKLSRPFTEWLPEWATSHQYTTWNNVTLLVRDGKPVSDR